MTKIVSTLIVNITATAEQMVGFLSSLSPGTKLQLGRRDSSSKSGLIRLIGNVCIVTLESGPHPGLCTRCTCTGAPKSRGPPLKKLGCLERVKLIQKINQNKNLRTVNFWGTNPAPGPHAQMALALVFSSPLSGPHIALCTGAPTHLNATLAITRYSEAQPLQSQHHL